MKNLKTIRVIALSGALLAFFVFGLQGQTIISGVVTEAETFDRHQCNRQRNYRWGCDGF